ncbi:N-acetylmuramoyl-L-alanine amidase [Helicobacter sp. MIT 05-5294]|uniref:N-acetylmuramoyl-L-alanine amidase n=1 Tax=Helicobacter sp. MIT 05-5294 TaxID=1548150 RepID=UPI001EE7AAEA|nr:N-acetylmuramoyl-L-alanine amidase [Helicobacter sp. MIT 05-5294]
MGFYTFKPILIKLRRDEVSLHNGNTRKEVLKLHNEFVGVNRGILIHKGESPKISEGCLLIGEKEVAPYMLETEMETMVKQVVLRLNEQTNQSTQTDKRLENFLKNNIEVRIQNNFKIPQPPKIESQNKNYFIDDEGYLHWSPKGGNEVKRAREIWQKVKHADQTRQLVTALEKGSLTKQQTKAIVLHRTDTDTSLQAINGFLRGVGTHFLIDKDGAIYQCASLCKWTQHVGKIGSKCYNNNICGEDYRKKILNYYQGKIPKQIHNNVRKEEEKNFIYPNRYPINSESIGIEVVGKANNLQKMPIDKKYPQITSYTASWDIPTRAQKDSIKT